jgi:uncharacterized protein (DUF58 family)
MRWPRFLGPLRRVEVWHLPLQRMRWTPTGWGYLAVSFGLLATGLYQQINLLLLTAGLTIGPIVASLVISRSMLAKVELTRRLPEFLFAGEPLVVDYILENRRKRSATLALEVDDELTPVDLGVPDAARALPRVIFNLVPAGGRRRVRWQGPGLVRGRYAMGDLLLSTRSPFGLHERSKPVPRPDTLVVYPAIGRLRRRWHQLHRESTQSRKGRRHDRTAQQQEYHGLREYRPGDSMRWIHWRTTARLGSPMVKEFEQQDDQELAVLIDGWLPRSKVTPAHREVLERAIRFAATVCFETCRQSGRRLVLGWTGPSPEIRQGPASVKLLHEALERLATLRGSAEGQLSALFDVLPPSSLREATILVVSTRPVHLAEEFERSRRLADGALRGMASRILVLDASRGDLDALIDFGEEGDLFEFGDEGLPDNTTLDGQSAAARVAARGARR